MRKDLLGCPGVSEVQLLDGFRSYLAFNHFDTHRGDGGPYLDVKFNHTGTPFSN